MAAPSPQKEYPLAAQLKIAFRRFLFRMNYHLSKLISKWIWIFSSTSILDEFLAMIASSWLLVAIHFNFQTQN